MAPCRKRFTVTARTSSRKEPVRFDSFRLRTFQETIGSVRFGSVRLGNLFVPARPGSACGFRTRRGLGPVRFGSFYIYIYIYLSLSLYIYIYICTYIYIYISRQVPAFSEIKQFGSVRPVWIGFLFLPDYPMALVRTSSDGFPAMFIAKACGKIMSMTKIKREYEKYKQGNTNNGQGSRQGA